MLVSNFGTIRVCALPRTLELINYSSRSSSTSVTGEVFRSWKDFACSDNGREQEASFYFFQIKRARSLCTKEKMLFEKSQSTQVIKKKQSFKKRESKEADKCLTFHPQDQKRWEALLSRCCCCSCCCCCCYRGGG
jgi:hypothetical protein